MPGIHREALLEIAKRYATPLYVYDDSSIKNTYFQLKNSLPPSVSIFYSIKANPNISLISTLYHLGAGVELCSYYEILAALRAGCHPKRMIYLGPAKTILAIKKCLSLGVGAIVCESINELQKISKIAKSINQVAKIIFRINPARVAKTALLKMGGQASAFGIDEDLLFSSQSLFLHKENIHILGIHLYMGTRILDAETIVENTRYILALADRLQQQWGIPFSLVDIGGGLGIPYYTNETTLSLEKLGSELNNVISPYITRYPQSKILLESGRFLIGKSGFFVSQVVDIKFSKGETIVITDGGSNCYMAAVGLGSYIRRNFPISVLQHKISNLQKVYTITGPLCTPNDLIAKSIRLCEISVGDYILVHSAGAYGLTASPTLFLSQQAPVEILYREGSSYLIRRRPSEKEFFKQQTCADVMPILTNNSTGEHYE